MKLNVYLTFDGQCAEAFKFYEQNLGARTMMMMKHGDSPMAGHVGPEWQDKIMHGVLGIADTVVMASDNPPQFRVEPKGFALSLGFDDPVEAERIFGLLSEGGTVGMPLQETFWALRFGMVVDKFGTPWMINCERPS